MLIYIIYLALFCAVIGALAALLEFIFPPCFRWFDTKAQSTCRFIADKSLERQLAKHYGQKKIHLVEKNSQSVKSR